MRRMTKIAWLAEYDGKHIGAGVAEDPMIDEAIAKALGSMKFDLRTGTRLVINVLEGEG